MLLDASLQLSSAQAVTTTAVSTNTVDFGSVLRDMSPGVPLFAVFGVDTTVTAAGAATVTFQVIASASASLTSPTVLAESDAIGKAELTAGRRLFALSVNLARLAAAPNGQRYLGAQYTVGTGPLSAGAFTCYIADSVPTGVQVLYPAGFAAA